MKTKNFEKFLNENYYETSSTMVPGQGVGAGLFSNVGTSTVSERNVPQDGANGVKQDPDYVPPAENTHAVYQGQIQLGDMVENSNTESPFYKSFGKAFAIMGSGDKAMVEYIIANESGNYAIGEVARCSADSLNIVKKHQMNG